MEKQMMVNYANSVTVSYSPFEMRMEFFVETPVDNEELQREKIADIRIAPQLAKELQAIVGSCVEDYEKNIGKLPVTRNEEN